MSTQNQLGGPQSKDADRLTSLFYPIYERFFDEDGDLVLFTERSLAASRSPANVELYIAKSLGIGVLTGLALWLIGLLAGFVVFNVLGLADQFSLGIVTNDSLVQLIELLRVPFFVLFTGLILGTIGFIGAFGARIFLPYTNANSREREINKLMPDALSFMYALSVGGMNQLEIIESMARAEDTYGAISQEFQSIVRETQFFDTDYKSAIENQAVETPSTQFSQFLRDMLSILNSGGDLEGFLDDKKDKYLRQAQQTQRQTLETLELFGEMYMVLSLFPLLLIIVLVAMSLLGDADVFTIYMVIYGLLPLIGVAFVVLISTFKQDEIGTGELTLYGEGAATTVNKNVVVDSGVVTNYQGEYKIFDVIREGEDTFNTIDLLRRPQIFFRDNPLYVLALTIPATVAVLSIAFSSGSAPTSWDVLIANPVWGTFIYVYLPLYINGLPLAVFFEWNQRHRYGITNELSDTLRKLSSANETGQTLFESMNTVAQSSRGRLAKEFEIMYNKIKYGTNVKRALVEFNNKYRIPRLARTIKLISKSQEASSQISKVLTTAAQASENQDQIDTERKNQARMQVVIISMTYFTLLFVFAILQTQFIDVMADLGGGADVDDDVGAGGDQFGVSIDPLELSTLFFHAVTIQAVMSGLISGYMRDGKLMSGLKYAVIFATIALLVWSWVGGG